MKPAFVNAIPAAHELLPLTRHENASQPRGMGHWTRLPVHAPGMRIGLFGGTFNPPHQGHRLASLMAMARLGLDRVWWMVTPGNPLKDNLALPPLPDRMAAAVRIASHPRIDITGFEAEIGTRFSHDTISFLQRRCPGVQLVWIMGADNLASLHRWQRWRDIVRMVPIAIIDRPGSTLRAVHGRAGASLAGHRLDESDGKLLAQSHPPAYIFLHGRRSSQSSTALRLAAQKSAAPDQGILTGHPENQLKFL